MSKRDSRWSTHVAAAGPNAPNPIWEPLRMKDIHVWFVEIHFRALFDTTRVDRTPWGCPVSTYYLPTTP